MSFLVGMVQIVASLSFVWASKTLIDIATENNTAPIMTFVWLMLVIMLIQILLRLFATWWEKMNVLKTQNTLRHYHFEHILNSLWKGKEDFHSADMVNRLEEDIRLVTELLCVRVPGVIVTVCQLVAAAVYAIIIAPGLIWMVMIMMMVAIIGARMFFNKLRSLTKTIREKDSQVQQVFQDNLRLRDLVLMLFGPSKVMGRLDYIQDDIEDLTRKRLKYSLISRGFMAFGFMGGYAATFFWGVFGIYSGSVTYGMMTAMLQLVGQVQRPISEVGHAIPAFIHAVTSIERLSELTDLQREEVGDGILFEGAPQIDISHVSFSYPETKELILNNFSFTFAPGSMTAVMGLTGAGKSTLLRIIMGLLRPNEGSAQISGIVDGRHRTVPISASTRENFTYVPQGNTLLSGTIRENLLLVNPHADEAEIEKVLKVSQADFVYHLPKGLDTMCGEDGSGLSEGQCQRLAIARALLKKGGVLLLDEATSALDSHTEHNLLQALCNNYRGEKTIVFISHHDAVAASADNVLRLFSSKNGV